ncbi:APC family permease [Agreia bicolorata]|uniref:APC family permease n=1 Tax=Agreia bicolorata TaxID=110935 RepID=UPI0005CA2ACF|nr:APC family permease [Agreia bicolorata]
MSEQQSPESVQALDPADQKLAELGYSQELKRTMSLLDVVVFGLIFMVPMAPVAVFGVIFSYSGGMVALVYLVAGLAMVFSALSYQTMAKEFPVAGSVYSYVRMSTSKFLGFIAGWAILLDYLLLPALLTILGASALTSIAPEVPGWVWVVAFVVAASIFNLRGLSMTKKLTLVFLGIQLVALVVFVVAALLAISQGRATFSLSPFYNPEYFSSAIVFGAIPLAALSYVGFDAIATLNEEAKGGGRTVSRATIIVLVLVIVMFVAQVYLAALFVPTEGLQPGVDTNNAFYDIVGVIVSPWFKALFVLLGAFVSIFANLLVSHATTSKLVFAMARDRQLPHGLAKISPRTGAPSRSMLLISAITLVISILALGNIELLTTMVTFGALTAYILLHVAVLIHFGFRGRSRSIFVHWVSPVVGILVLGYALWSTNDIAKIVGVSWLVVGTIVGWVVLSRARRESTESRVSSDAPSAV